MFRNQLRRILAGSLAVSAAAQAPAPFKRTVLQQADLSAPGREVVQALAEVQPGASAGRHYPSSGEEIAYVLAGPVVVEIDRSRAPKTLQTGEAFLIPGRQDPQRHQPRHRRGENRRHLRHRKRQKPVATLRPVVYLIS